MIVQVTSRKEFISESQTRSSTSLQNLYLLIISNVIMANTRQFQDGRCTNVLQKNNFNASKLDLWYDL